MGGYTLRTIGYVCVHGIGAQREGATAEAVKDCFSRTVSATGGDYRSLAIAGQKPGLVGRGLVSTNGEQFIAEFYDAWWDQKVVVPRFQSVAAWMIRIFPFAAAVTIALWSADLQSIRRSKRLSELMPVPLTTFLGVAGLIVLTPLLILASLVGSLLALTSKKVAKKLSFLVRQVLGDAWLYRTDMLDKPVIDPLAAFLERVKRDCDDVVLVGHSLGAEISRRVAVKTRPTACVYVGSGQAQLTAHRILRRSP